MSTFSLMDYQRAMTPQDEARAKAIAVEMLRTFRWFDLPYRAGTTAPNGNAPTDYFASDSVSPAMAMAIAAHNAECEAKREKRWRQ